MARSWFPKVLAAIGFAGLGTSYACFPLTIAEIPLPGTSPTAPPAPTQPQLRTPGPSASPSPSPAAEPSPSPAAEPSPSPAP